MTDKDKDQDKKKKEEPIELIPFDEDESIRRLLRAGTTSNEGIKKKVRKKKK